MHNNSQQSKNVLANYLQIEIELEERPLILDPSSLAYPLPISSTSSASASLPSPSASPPRAPFPSSIRFNLLYESPSGSPAASIRPNLLYGAASPERLTLSPDWERERAEEAEQLPANSRQVQIQQTCTLVQQVQQSSTTGTTDVYNRYNRHVQQVQQTCTTGTAE